MPDRGRALALCLLTNRACFPQTLPMDKGWGLFKLLIHDA